jgi:diadenosine tetraphosphate (Ap4A) HIT family hydrolase
MEDNLAYSELIKKERPCPFDNPDSNDVVTENETAYLTYSLAAYHLDQLLVVPKRHVTHVDSLTPQEIADCQALQNTGWALLRELGHGGVSFLLREGDSTGKSVQHIHYNLIPDTRLGDMDAKGEERRNIMNKEEIAATMARLRQALAKHLRTS